MAARKPRRRAAPAGRLRRWLRRRRRPGRGLAFATLAIGALFVWLTLVSEKGKAPEPGAAKPTASRPRSPSRAVPRAPAAATPEKRAQQEPSAPRPTERQQRHAAEAGQPRPRAAPAERTAPAAAPRAAIVIDDLGQRLAHFEQVAALGIPLTIAVIPGLPATEATVREASRRNIEMILHQPMEPREEGGKDPGAGVLLTAMNAEEIRGRLRESLAAVPGAIGVNNHMGSRFTEEDAGLQPLMSELKARGLFWLDSRTTGATRGAEAARSAGVAAIERDVFLDAKVSADFTRRQVRRLLALARTRGSAVGIGHPHPQTLAALRELRGELLESGVTLVPLSALVPAVQADAAGAALAAAHRAERSSGDRSAARAGP